MISIFLNLNKIIKYFLIATEYSATKLIKNEEDVIYGLDFYRITDEMFSCSTSLTYVPIRFVDPCFVLDGFFRLALSTY